jgi:hypothetical protein
MNKPLTCLLLILVHLVLSVNALIAGGMMMIKPDGSLLGMQTGRLSNSPFSNYFIPGLFLFTMVGGVSLFSIIGLIAKPAWPLPQKFNLYKDKHWAWTWSLYSGIIVIAWIAIQLLMTDYFWLQPVIIFLGLLIIILTMTPGIINYYKR